MAAKPRFRYKDARADVAAVADHIRRRRGIDRLCLIGWSWGCATMGSFAAMHPDRVDRLVLFAPGWVRDGTSAADPGGSLGAWRGVTREAALARWLNGVPEDKRDRLIPPGWFDRWADATFATDPTGAAMHPPVLARTEWGGGGWPGVLVGGPRAVRPRRDHRADDDRRR